MMPTIPDIAENAEKSFEAVFKFLGRMIAAIFRISFAPRRTGGFYVTNPERLPRPLNFLAMTAFFAIRLLRTAVFLVLFFSNFLFYGCSGEDSYDDPTGLYLESQLTLPSIDEVLIFGIPMVAVGLMLAWLLSHVRALRTDSADGPKDVVSAGFCYVAGTQYLFFLPIAVLASGAAIWNLSGGGGLSDWVFIVPIVAFVVVWPWVCFHRFVAGAHAAAGLTGIMQRHSRWVRLRASVATLLAVVTPVLCALGIAYPLGLRDYEAFLELPVIRAGLTKLERADDGSFQVEVLIENPGAEGIYLLGSPIQLVSRQGIAYAGSAEVAGATPSVVNVPPKGQVLIRSQVILDIPTVTVTMPLMSGSPGRIAMRRISLSASEDSNVFDDDDSWIFANFRYGEFDDGTTVANISE